jgi:pyruvate,water dikinase
VFKPTLAQGYRRVLRRNLGSKKVRMIYAEAAGREATRNVPTDRAERERYCIGDDEVLALAEQAVIIEDHYSRRAGHPVPMDIEWARDGIDGRLYIVQARPETVASRKELRQIETYRVRQRADVLARGRAVGEKAVAGRVRVIAGPGELHLFQPGEILVADATTPDWGTVMKAAAAIVTNRGGRTCHAAIVARELGVPAVVGCGDATTRLRTGDEVTVSCAEGDAGRVYAGRLPVETARIDVATLPRTRTRLMVNLGNPDVAFRTSLLPNDGVGLARMEFIIAEHIRIHPMALIHPEKVADPAARIEIARLTAAYPRPSDYFVERLAEGVATIAAAFYPKPVIVRTSDFKTNEYASLLGGAAFEPREENPMIGFRGASRYAHPAYAEGFALECAAMRRVRDEMGLTNVKLMIPFVRRVAEAERVIAEMAARGLHRGERGLEIYVMCEIPNNVIQVDAFARCFDGFSIGSNDLTQLALGVDRDSGVVAFEFDERDAGVKELIRLAVEGAHRNGRHIGICGQAPSDYPDMLDFLVGLGIDSISLTPDTILAAVERVAAAEARMGASPKMASV